MTGYVYGFEFCGDRTTTTGEPNSRTHRCNIAGSARAFRSREERSRWIKSARLGRLRQAVTFNGLKSLQRGLTGEEFREMCLRIQFDADQIELFE